MNTLKPIKRDPSLVAFSKDHHFGLLLLWKIRYGMRHGITAERICNYVVYFFEQELLPHFADEEQLLLPLLADTDPKRIRVEAEHVAMRKMAEDIRNRPDLDLALQFGQLLEAHIRFEERELFNYLQDNVSRDVLDAIPAAMHQNNHNSDSKWPDQFWNGPQK